MTDLNAADLTSLVSTTPQFFEQLRHIASYFFSQLQATDHLDEKVRSLLSRHLLDTTAALTLYTRHDWISSTVS